MKRMTIILLILSLLLTAGCGARPEETAPTGTTETVTQPTVTETTEPETTAPTEPPEPDTVDFTVRADRTPAVLALLSRGETVEVLGQLEGYHVIRLPEGCGLVEQGLLRAEGEAPYEGWTGYAYYGAELKGSYQLTGEPLQTLTVNTQVQVLDELPHSYLVQLGEVTGYMAKSGLSRYPIRSGGGGGGGGGGQDGGDITMGFTGGIGRLGYTVPQEGEPAGTATAKCDGAMVLLGWFDREETARVITQEGFAPAWEGWHSVYLKGFCVYVPQGLLQDPSAGDFAQWDGYSAYSTKIYDNYLLLGEPAKVLTVNTLVTVLWDTGMSLVISVDGEIFYADAADFSTTRRSTGGGGGGGGGEWTPPAL